MRVLLILLLFTNVLQAKPMVVATFSVLGNMVQEIGQDKIDLKTLVGPDQDTHVYEPRPGDAKNLSKADLVVVNGLGFEGWLNRLIEASGFQGKIITVTQGISPLMFDMPGRSIPDPHAWHSLQNAQIYVDNIVKGLSDLLPEEAAFFQERGAAYKASLKALEEEIQEELAPVPLGKRKVVTAHEAFDYMGREFGITFLAPLGVSTDAEPSAKAIANLIRLIRKEDMKSIFVENISNPRLIEQIARETGVKAGGVLYSDALSPPGTPGDTYLKMMSHNLSTLSRSMREDGEP